MSEIPHPFEPGPAAEPQPPLDAPIASAAIPEKLISTFDRGALATRHPVLRHGVGIALGILAFVFTRLANLEPAPFSPLLAFVAVSAWYGGAVPGLVTAALGLASIWYFLIAPFQFQDSTSRGDLLRIGSFATAALILCGLTELLHRARLRAEVHADRARRARAQAEADRAAVSSILESLREGFTAYDHAWRFTYINASANQLTLLLARPREDLLGKVIWEEFPALVGTPFHAEALRAARDQKAVEFEAPYEPLGRWYSVRLYPTPDGLVAYARDITKRREREQALRTSEQRFASFMTYLPGAAWIKDLDGRYVYVNPPGETVFHLTLDEMRGKTDLELWPTEIARQFRENDRRALAERGGLQTIETLPQADGLHYSIVSKFPIFGAEGAAEFVAGVAFDITERILAEEARERLYQDAEAAREELRRYSATLERRVAERTAAAEARADELARSNAELERFAYVASHDLQEPLRMVTNFTQLLQHRYQGKLGPDADEFIRYAISGVERMHALITDLLAYSRVRSRPLEPSAVDLAGVMDEVVDGFQAALADHQAIIERDTLPTVHADRTQMVQLFQNLLGNALKFRAVSAPRIRVWAEPASGPSGLEPERGGKDGLRPSDARSGWILNVQDNGIGIAPEHRERIFVVFQRLHGPTDYPGTGIGLAICKQVVERHLGRIWVEEAPGGGSVFRFVLPQAKAER